MRLARLTGICLGTLAFASSALAEEPLATTGLEPYLAPGMELAELRRALGDDLGSGLAGAIPRALIEAVVELDPERFGGSVREAYRRYGMLFLAERPELPVGIVEREILGMRYHNFNCLACHAGPWRSRGADETKDLLVVGATNSLGDLTDWYGDLFAAAARADSATTLLAAADRHRRRHEGEGLGVQEAAAILAFRRSLDRAPGEAPPARYGPGRTLVQGAYRVLRFGLDPGPFAPVKPPDLFGVRYRKSLLWGGNETYPDGVEPVERIARNGLLVPWIQLHPLTERPVPDAVALLRLPRYRRMAKFLTLAQPPPAPAPAPDDETRLFERGRAVYEANCSKCHGRYEFDDAPLPGGGSGLVARPIEYEEKLVAVGVVGTDPSYASSLDDDYARAYHETLYARIGLFGSRMTGAYVARPHLGLRLRAPFLHNASVPNLALLLTSPDRRPVRFLTGLGVPYDDRAGGFASIDPPPEALDFDPPRGLSIRRGDLAGGRPDGHPFGTMLSENEKRELLSYLTRL